MPLPLPTYFNDFLQEIRPTPAQRASMAEGHLRLQERLRDDSGLAEGIVGMFLQGSYRRYTAVRPRDGKRSDVDIIVVTKMAEAEFTPARAMACFQPFLERHYKDKYRVQGRSFGIEMSEVEMDLVITAAPSEAVAGVYSELGRVEDELRLDEDVDEAQERKLIKKAEAAIPAWKMESLRIPDRDQGQWQDTDPLTQLKWTWRKNADCSGHFVNVVKALKWWRLEHLDQMPERPKSYPLEHLIGDCCPDGIGSVAEGIVRTLERIARGYEVSAAAKSTPVLLDRGVDQNVMARIDGNDFARFHAQAVQAAAKARQAFDATDAATAAALWRELLGDRFPKGGGGFTPHKGGPGDPGPTRFA